jgi:hypothetical protein
VTLGRYAFRGAVAAMAMTGLRKVTEGLGLLEETPPEQIARDTPLLRPLLDRVPAEYHAEVIEFAHWAYGAGGGVLFGLVVPERRQTRQAGIAYGLVTWAFFETGLVPLLGLTHGDDKEISSRVFVALDHVLYGILVAGEQ